MVPVYNSAVLLLNPVTCGLFHTNIPFQRMSQQNLDWNTEVYIRIYEQEFSVHRIHLFPQGVKRFTIHYLIKKKKKKLSACLLISHKGFCLFILFFIFAIYIKCHFLYRVFLLTFQYYIMFLPLSETYISHFGIMLNLILIKTNDKAKQKI